MKKNFLWIAAAATVMASCAQFDTYREISQENDSAISFTSYASVQTKAADNNKDATTLWDLENHHTSFSVWAWKYGDYDNATPANNPIWSPVWNRGTGNVATGTVSYSNSAWAASPLRFWDKSAVKYYFYAAAPANQNWILAGDGAANTYYLTLANFTLAGTNIESTSLETSFSSVADVDLMIAENNEVARSAYNKAAPDEVNEKFDHILSRLNVSVALKAGGTLAALNADQDNTNDVVVKVTNFAITGVNLNNKGSFNENAQLTGNLEDGTIERWSNLSINNEPYNLGGFDISSTALTTTATYISQYLIIPQEITSEVLDRKEPKLASDGTTAASHPYFIIAYTINDEPFYAYYNLANAFGVAAGSKLAFNEGWANTLNIKIDADAIVFDPQVYQWTDAINHDITEVD